MLGILHLTLDARFIAFKGLDWQMGFWRVLGLSKRLLKMNVACYGVMRFHNNRGVPKRDIYRLPLLEGGFGTKLASRQDDIPVWH